MKLLLDTTTIKDIPVLIIAPEGVHRAPVIFYISGFGDSKESGLSIGYRLARQGFVFVAFDAWLHGERYDPRLETAADPTVGGIYPPATGLDTFILFYRVIHHCLLDVQRLLDAYSADLHMDVNCCGVTGPSMGGYASFLIFANLPQMRAAVPMIGIPSFTRRWLDLLDECAFSNPAWATALQQVEEQTWGHTVFAQTIDPFEKLKAAVPRSLLIMNCDFDSDQPKHYAIDAYRNLQPAYAAYAEHLKLNIYPAGHVVTPTMEQDAVDRFARHLLGADR